jgi:mannose-6-phosphate isomerase
MIKAPIKFIPVLKEKIWGGTKLIDMLHKESSIQIDMIGESWEISTVNDVISVVSDGKYKGKTLLELIKLYPKGLLGNKVAENFPDEFPLLIKFIDAKTDLSIQLHPDDELAKKRHQSYGKTEMWYVMQAEEDAEIILGFNKKISKKTYNDYLNKGEITKILNFIKVKKGDVFFIPTGTIHAIGAGVLLAEIQQTSDITYRVYDWNRTDKNGKPRKLHTKEALDALDFSINKTHKVTYNVKENTSHKLVECPYFNADIVSVNGKINKEFNKRDSFTIFMCVSGDSKINYQGGSVSLSYGETILIPNVLNKIEIEAVNKAELLEVYI